MVGSGTTLVTPSALQVNINDQGFVGVSQTIDLNIASNWDSSSADKAVQSNRAGQDFYVYVIATSTGKLKFLLSANSTTPSGYEANESRKIGGFHCLCADVGTIENHPLSGAQAGDILPNSVWDLLHRPISEPEGMVWVDGISKWVDIYLASWDATENHLVSVYNGTTADGGSTVKFHGEKFAEEFGLIGKHLPMRDDFLVFAKGSNENTNITGSDDKVYAGGWTDTAGRRMISNYGIEDCCGFLMQWTSDVYTPVLPNSWSNSGVYNSSVDSQKYGQSYGSLYRASVGGHWNYSSYCGSRCVNFSNFSSNVDAGLGGRAASEPRRFE